MFPDDKNLENGTGEGDDGHVSPTGQVDQDETSLNRTVYRAPVAWMRQFSSADWPAGFGTCI